MDLRFLLFVVVVVAVQTQRVSADYMAPKCNPEVVKGIEAHWAEVGKPTELFKKTGTVWKVYKNTDSGVYGDATCVTYTPLGDGKVSINIGSTVFNNITMTLKDGFIKVSGDEDLHYLVISSSQVMAVYRCNPKGPLESATVQPDAAVLSNHNTRTENLLTTIAFMRGLGLNMNKSFYCIEIDN